MILGTLKLDMNDNYVYTDKTLPRGPKWDKEFLKEMVERNIITSDGNNILPPSIRNNATLVMGEPTLAIKVSEIDALADLLIVTRVTSISLQGKKFRFNRFKKVVSTGMIELWVRKTDD